MGNANSLIECTISDNLPTPTGARETALVEELVYRITVINETSILNINISQLGSNWNGNTHGVGHGYS